MIEVKDIAEYEENDSELAKYTISKLSSEKKELQQRIDKAIEILSEDFRKCPMSLTLEKSYIIEQDKIKKALNILKGSEEDA